jgi:dihydrolipoamide dehydrogenase
MTEHAQCVVIGGGPGGYAAAFRAADLGLSVTLIDPEDNPGGVCLYRGCIPSKALLNVARTIDEAAAAKAWGIAFSPPGIELAALRAFKEGVVKKLTGGLGQLLKPRKIRHIQGLARFIDHHTLEVSTQTGKNQLAFEKAIVASGSRPSQLPFAPESPKIMDSTTALLLQDIPEKLLVIGGGYIGLELGSVYASLGSKVTVVEMTDGLLPGADRDLAAVLEKRLQKKFAAIYLAHKVAAISEKNTDVAVRFEGPGGIQEETFDKVLIAIGRKPNSENLGLENTAIQVNRKGFIEVDASRRTAESHIFAIGDVAGEPMLAHKATHEGIVAAHAMAGEKIDFAPKAIPAVVFTEPEIAWCGLTENEAKQKGIPHEVATFPWGASGRAMTMDATEGLTKLLIDPESERILGVGLAGAGAGELIAEGVLAIEMGAVAKDMALSIHPHPTLSETMMEAAEMYHGLSLHSYRPKKK